MSLFGGQSHGVILLLTVRLHTLQTAVTGVRAGNYGSREKRDSAEVEGTLRSVVIRETD